VQAENSKHAKIGDWVVGLGSAHSPLGDISNRVIYAMPITRRLSMPHYDDFCRAHLPMKIPRWASSDPRRRVGDERHIEMFYATLTAWGMHPCGCHSNQARRMGSFPRFARVGRPFALSRE